MTRPQLRTMKFMALGRGCPECRKKFKKLQIHR